MVFILARATGWGENVILEMPYPKFLQYLHCHLVYQGAATRWEVTTQAERLEAEQKFNTFFSV